MSIKKKTRLLYGSSEGSADVLYFANAFVPDAFISLSIGKKKIGVFNALEYSRMLKESEFDEVLRLEDFSKNGGKPEDVICELAKKYAIDQFEVPSDFPVGLAFGLQKKGLKVEAVEGAFFPEREVKDEDQAKEIKKGNKASAAGIKAAEEALKRSEIKGNKLYLDGKVLTSERLRMLVNIACLENGAIPHGTIVAGGDQACDPHCVGFGPLKANELIIVDVFPRLVASGYHGDMTRTFLKGEASDAQIVIMKAVLEAQQKALDTVRAGVSGAKVHQAVTDSFEWRGFETLCKGGVYEGFFHGTGHGLGLEVHEEPRVSSHNKKGLKEGAVITIEPGLYYPGLGGCRIEDVVWVKKDGYEKLSSYHYSWHLK